MVIKINITVKWSRTNGPSKIFYTWKTHSSQLEQGSQRYSAAERQEVEWVTNRMNAGYLDPISSTYLASIADTNTSNIIRYLL